MTLNQYKEILNTIDSMSAQLNKLKRQVQICAQSQNLFVNDLSKIINKIEEEKALNPSRFYYISDVIKNGELSTRAAYCLLRSRFFLVRDLDHLSEKDYKRIRNCGKSSFSEIEEFMAKQNIMMNKESHIHEIAYREGDKVVNVVPLIYEGTILPEFSEFTIKSVRDINTDKKFVMPTYTATFLSDDICIKTISVSHGEIEKIS